MALNEQKSIVFYGYNFITKARMCVAVNVVEIYAMFGGNVSNELRVNYG